jgi:hypothetical protein
LNQGAAEELNNVTPIVAEAGTAPGSRGPLTVPRLVCLILSTACLITAARDHGTRRAARADANKSVDIGSIDEL